MHVSESTVKFHVANINIPTKVNAESRGESAAPARAV
ncbi:hypothetical protein NRF20_39620 [Streptomyces sp. R-74717]